MDCSAEYLTCVFISRSPHTRKHFLFFDFVTTHHRATLTTNLTQVVFKSCLHLLFYCPTLHTISPHRIFCQAHQLCHISVLTFQLHTIYVHTHPFTHSLIHSLTHSLKIVCECNVLVFLLPQCRSSHVVDAKMRKEKHLHINYTLTHTLYDKLNRKLRSWFCCDTSSRVYSLVIFAIKSIFEYFSKPPHRKPFFTMCWLFVWNLCDYAIYVGVLMSVCFT